MRLNSIRIRRYRSILDQQIDFDPLTAILGPNGAGKSSALRALAEFYSTTRTAEAADFYNRDSSAPIEISVTYVDLTDQERGLFQSYLQADTLTVTKVIEQSGERYHGTRIQNPDFAEVRRLQGKAERKQAYDSLRARAPYTGLPLVRSADQAETAMQTWEREHSEVSVPMLDDGRFFGFRQVGQSRLERFTRFVLVPAVRDAEQDAADARGSPIYQLMELAVRSALGRNAALAEFRARAQEEYGRLVSPETIPQLHDLETRLTSILRSYVPSAAVLLDWLAAEQIDIPLPKAQVRLDEDGFTAPVDRVGHGLQRAFILSLLQILASSLAEPTQEEEITETTETVGTIAVMPDLILAIEEPELYQHPNRQRYLCRILRSLADGRLPGVARRTQVLYCTHSPLFVDIANFDSVRRFHKMPNPGDSTQPLVTSVRSVSAVEVAAALAAVQDPPPGAPFTRESLLSRLVPLMGPVVNEGFFGDVVVLVEGEEDRAAILGCAMQMGIDLEARGVAVVPCSGKTNLDKPMIIFRRLGIPTYVIFDSDSTRGPNGHPATNRSLQRLLGISAVVDFPGTQASDGFAIFDTNLSSVMQARLGEELYAGIVERFVGEFGYANADACRKSPMFVRALLEEGRQQERNFDELAQAVNRIVNLVPPRVTPGREGD